jgi:hypothetical protein
VTEHRSSVGIPDRIVGPPAYHPGLEQPRMCSKCAQRLAGAGGILLCPECKDSLQRLLDNYWQTHPATSRQGVRRGADPCRPQRRWSGRRSRGLTASAPTDHEDDGALSSVVVAARRPAARDQSANAALAPPRTPSAPGPRSPIAPTVLPATKSITAAPCCRFDGRPPATGRRTARATPRTIISCAGRYGGSSLRRFSQYRRWVDVVTTLIPLLD